MSIMIKEVDTMIMANILLAMLIAYGVNILFRDIGKLKKELLMRNRLKHISTKSSISIEEFNDLASIRS